MPGVQKVHKEAGLSLFHNAKAMKVIGVQFRTGKRRYFIIAELWNYFQKGY